MNRMLFLVAVLLTGLGPASQAEEVGDDYLEPFQLIGVVDGIDLANLFLVVSDTQIPLATDVQIHDPSGRSMALAEIQPGMKVGLVTTDETGKSTGRIHRIQVLPERFNQYGSEE